MFQDIEDGVEWLLGLNATSLTIGHMALRAAVVYVAALAMVRLGEKRFFGKNTAFDVALAIIFGSVVSRAITGSSAFFPTLAAALVLVLMHWLFATIAFHSDRFGTLIKGRSQALVIDGEIVWDAMQRHHISRKDLYGALRRTLNSEDLQKVQRATIERSGDISFIPGATAPEVVEIDVAEGIQTVRIKLDA